MRVPAEADFGSRLRSAAVTARVGTWLAVCFTICFVTGLISHYAQNVSQPIPFPTSPSWGYRVTQGLHVITGTAAVPLFLVKLWTVYPKLFARRPRDVRRLALHGVERVSIAVLVAGAIFQLASGLLNSAQWYPWAFSFRATHYAVGWITIGALVVHVAVKLPVIRRALVSDLEADGLDRPGTREATGGLTRRGLLRSTWLASGVAVLATAGSTVPLLRKVSVFGVRSGDGPAGIPINKSARAAGVTASATSASATLTVAYGGREVVLRPGELAAMSGTDADLPIACVEGWSASGTWTGVRVRELLDLVDAPAGCDVRVTSLQERGAFRASTLPGTFVDDPLTLLATGLDGETLALDHGYPCRIIAPNRPGVLQTKWVSRLDVIA